MEEEWKHRIKLAIADRLKEGASQCNSAWFDHNDGVVRGLLWALTGEDPGTYLLSRRVEAVLKLAGFDYTKDGEEFRWRYADDGK